MAGEMWKYAVITTKGLLLQGKVAAGGTIEFTKVKTGAGTVEPVLLQAQTDITDKKQEFIFAAESSVNKETGLVSLVVVINNDGLESSYDCYQVGVYATDPDDGEILYAILQSESAMTVPAEAELVGWIAEMNIGMQYGNAETVNITMNQAGMVSKEEFDKHTHTASDVGARPNTWMPTADDVGAYSKKEMDELLENVAPEFTINGKSPDASGNITLTATDVGAAKASHHKWREYNDLSDIGITEGSETFETILTEMPTYSQLSYVTAGSNNKAIYPYIGGICEIKKLTNIYAKITFSMPSGGVKRGLYEAYCDYKNGAWVISEWYKFYNELTPPDASDVGALGYAGEMSANDDLNNYKTIGSYTATSAVTATLSNCPFSSGASQLYVLATGGDTNPLLQIITQSTTLNTNLYVRKHVSNGWTAWKQFAFTDKFVPLDGSVEMTGPLKYNDGTTIHDYYGTHNITHGTASLTAGVSPLGKNCIYLKTK